MLIKLSVVKALHLVKYKSRITFCDDNSSILNYISNLNLDDGNSCSQFSILEVFISTGSFSDGTLLDQDSLGIITFGELKNLYQEVRIQSWYLFIYLLGKKNIFHGEEEPAKREK